MKIFIKTTNEVYRWTTMCFGCASKSWGGTAPCVWHSCVDKVSITKQCEEVLFTTLMFFLDHQRSTHKISGNGCVSDKKHIYNVMQVVPTWYFEHPFKCCSRMKDVTNDIDRPLYVGLAKSTSVLSSERSIESGREQQWTLPNYHLSNSSTRYANGRLPMRCPSPSKGRLPPRRLVY